MPKPQSIETRKLTYAEAALLDLLPALSVPDGGRVLVAGNRSGWLPLEAEKRWPKRVAAHVFDFHHARAVRDRLSDAWINPNSIVHCAPYVPEGPYALALFMTTPQSMSAELVLDHLEDIRANLAEGGALVAAFEGDADDALHALRLVWPNVRVLSRAKHVSVFRMTKHGGAENRRNFASDWEASVPGGEKMTFTSLPGCFCHRRPDAGGLALAEVAARESAADDRLLDMGCGCGLVGLLVAKKAGITDVTMVDSHARAIAAAKINAERAGIGARFVLSDDGLPRGEEETGRYSLVVGNPPYYSDYRIAEVFMETAYRALRPGGRCLMVVKTATGLLALQEKYFRTVEIIKRRGYSVLRSVRTVLASLAAFAAAACCQGGEMTASRPVNAPDSLKVLMIGNSFSISNLRQMPQIAGAMGKKLDIASLYIGGCSLERHWNNATNATLRPYRFDRVVDGRKTVVKGRANVVDALALDKWDVVTVQQASHLSWRTETYEPFGGLLVAKIRELAPQARIFVQETWSYPPWDARLAKFGFGQKEMYSRLHAAYAGFAARHRLAVIPVGTAAETISDRNSLFTKPDFHFNSNGEYLQGLVFMATLFRVDVKDCPYRPSKMAVFRADEMKSAAMAALPRTGIAEKYYRLAIREIGGGDILQLGEFSLYAADGSRVNCGMKLASTREAKSLAPGECFASKNTFARETAEKLFDGNPGTKLCVGALAPRADDPASWLYVCHRLPDGAKPVAKFNFCSADDTDRYPERNPTSWAIWCSADGETWRLVDERSNVFSPKSMFTWYNGSRPYSFGGEKPCEDMADEVNPFIGAVTQHPRSALGGHGLGKTFPGAATPFGMVQLSPDTVTGGDNGCGYSYHHPTIEGFSFTHLSGVGWYGDFGNFQVMPATGERLLDRDKAKSPYSHEREVAKAGYYAVTLDRYGIRAEMAAAPRAGIMRFTFPESKNARVQIDLGRRVGQLGRWLKHSRQHVRVVDDHTIEGRMECPWQDGGWGHGHGRVSYTLHYTCAFSKPFKRFGAWDKDAVFENCRDYAGTNTGFFAEFETAPGEQILLRTGLSYVDQDGARKNLAHDIPDFDFDRARAAAHALWSDAFAGVKVKGGSVDDRVVFATCLYHAFIDPRTIGDVDGRYMGSNGKIYRNDRFTARTVFSGWDVFRSEMPLLTLIRPDVVNDTINSMIRWTELGPRDTLPVWDLFGCTSGCMIGNPLIPCIADAYEKGIRNWDAETAWRLADATSRKRGNAACGWNPGSLSVTLEYAYDDWCMGKFAEMTGRTDDAKRYYGRAGWYKNIWSEEAKWMRSRNADGTWTPWRGRHIHGQGAVESNPWQQGWFVPHDVYGLMALMGGAKKFADELELFFDKAPANFMWGDCYNHPNEITHLAPFMFPFCGKPWLTQKWTRRICEGAYGNEVYGYVGNEDEGQMSAWYILAASGLHPACPGSGVWIVTSPMFPEISFRLDPKYAKGGRFTVRANGVSKANVYIRSAKLNGKPLDRMWITTKEVRDGGTLELEMGAEPAKDAFPVRPPSTMPR